MASRFAFILQVFSLLVYKNVADGSHHVYVSGVNDRASFYEAVVKCKMMGMDLVSITNSEIYGDVTEKLQSGIIDLIADGKNFFWVDQVNKPANRNVPYHNRRQCSQIIHKQINDHIYRYTYADCTDPQRYICMNSMDRSQNLEVHISNEETRATFYEASTFCSQINMHLAYIPDNRTNNFLIGKVKDELQYSKEGLFWIGGIRSKNKHDFMWFPSNSLFSFSNWNAPEEYLNPHGDCVMMKVSISTETSKWRNVDCSRRLRFICTKSQDGPGIFRWVQQKAGEVFRWSGAWAARAMALAEAAEQAADNDGSSSEEVTPP